MKIIKEPRHNCHIGVEYCKLLKNVLSVPVYQCDVTVKTWQGMAVLISVICTVLFNSLSAVVYGGIKKVKSHASHSRPTWPELLLGFCSMKQLRVLLLPLGGMLVQLQGYAQQYVAGTQGNNTMIGTGP